MGSTNLPRKRTKSTTTSTFKMGMRVALPIFAVVLAGVMAVVAVDTAPSAASAPSPPVGIPQDWVAPWREGDLLFGTAEPQETFRQVTSTIVGHVSDLLLNKRTQAYMGNGYMATVVGSTDIYVSGASRLRRSCSFYH